MFMVLLKTNLNPKTHVCNFAPKLVELDEGKPLAKQFREHLACDRFDTLEVNIDGRPYTIVMDADGAANSKIPSYYVSSECIIFGDILFGHRNANYEIVGVEEKDAVFLAMHLLENTSRMNDRTADRGTTGTVRG
ncbi:hypothetical protein [uncultured Selenomonas sp.]|uniref:hypothetical protein n=1 Tax=uncultured Selenomonas sp. TaxID=159275 RepID=UPI0025F36792|nr:hypothetical protein [uncultured Selenomonas sp.]